MLGWGRVKALKEGRVEVLKISCENLEVSRGMSSYGVIHLLWFSVKFEKYQPAGKL